MIEFVEVATHSETLRRGGGLQCEETVSEELLLAGNVDERIL